MPSNFAIEAWANLRKKSASFFKANAEGETSFEF